MAVLWVDDGSYWSTMVSDSSLLVCRDVNTPRFRPWVTVTGKSPIAVKTSGQPDEPSSSEMDDLHSLSSAACFFGLEFTDKLECMGKLECMDEWFGLPRSRHLSLRRSGPDAGFVCGMRLIGHPLLLWIEDTFSVGCSCLSRSTLWR